MNGVAVKRETTDIKNAVPGAVLAEENGDLIVAPDKLVEFGKYLRDEAGYDYLSSVTGVDYLTYPGRDPSNRFEVVYHLYSIERGGGPLVLKVRVSEENPEVPSVVSVWPGASFQEREIWDLYGVKFPGHPNLRRILLWEGFNGHPMRKDWKEAYYEAEHKPFKSRSPKGGKPYHGEDIAPWHDNLVLPEGWDPDRWQEPVHVVPLPPTRGAGASSMKTEKVVVNVGPQHPSTHGVFRMIVELDGETIVAMEPEMGYLHRNHEKIGERNTWIMNIPYTDRLDYINSMTNNLGYVITVEKLMGLKVAERAEYLRVIMSELTRILNHFVAIGFLFNDLGAFYTPMLYGLEERELILDLFEMASGSRMMCNYMRFGGVARDVPEEFIPFAKRLVNERLPRIIDEINEYLTGNEIFLYRAKGVGVLPRDVAIAYSASGPVLRASGVRYDIRRAEPYSIYDRFDFDVVTETGGDVYDRYMVRLREMRESVKILKQALDQIPDGPIISGRKTYSFRPPMGDAYGRVEAPKGELGYYVVSDKTNNPYRYHVRAPSFINLTSLEPMLIGYKVADSVVVLGSVDIVLGEVDR